MTSPHSEEKLLQLRARFLADIRRPSPLHTGYLQFSIDSQTFLLALSEVNQIQELATSTESNHRPALHTIPQSPIQILGVLAMPFEFYNILHFTHILGRPLFQPPPYAVLFPPGPPNYGLPLYHKPKKVHITDNGWDRSNLKYDFLRAHLDQNGETLYLLHPQKLIEDCLGRKPEEKGMSGEE